MPDARVDPGSTLRPLQLQGADVLLAPRFLPAAQAELLLQTLITAIAWREEQVFVWGRHHTQPRLVAWYGDPDCRYGYSGSELQPQPWTPELLYLRERVELACAARFNSVLLNYYHHERDCMGLHSDDEPELGPRPTIASLSLGQERHLRFVPRRNRALQSLRLLLGAGSLLVMAGDTQQNWKHGIARSARPLGPRINLSFRCIQR